jgi:protein TonB
MNGDSKTPAAARSSPKPAGAVRKPQQELAFWVAFACAAVAHAGLIAGFVRSLPQRQMGETGGMPEGVSVAMVDPADLPSQNAFAEKGRPSLPVTQVPPAPPSSPPAPPVQEQSPESTPREKEQQTAEPVSPDKPARQGKDSKAPDTVPWPIDLKALEQGFSPNRSGKPRDAAGPRQTDKQPEQQQTAGAGLQLTLPDKAVSLDDAFSRPAGITRSGENDEFGRAVIRALRKTMPDMGATRGRVPVRLVISQDGNLAEVRLARSSGNPLLDRAVVFAVQQTSFPFPPPNAPPVDRTFLVTYIYDDRG